MENVQVTVDLKNYLRSTAHAGQAFDLKRNNEIVADGKWVTVEPLNVAADLKNLKGMVMMVPHPDQDGEIELTSKPFDIRFSIRMSRPVQPKADISVKGTIDGKEVDYSTTAKAFPNGNEFKFEFTKNITFPFGEVRAMAIERKEKTITRIAFNVKRGIFWPWADTQAIPKK